MSNPTPRQTPGEALVPVNGNVTAATKAALQQMADEQQRSVSQIVRRALEQFVMSSGYFERQRRPDPDDVA